MNSLAIYLVKTEEGYRRFPYKCPAGKLTIGYGLNLEDRGLPEEDAEILVARYLVELERSLRVKKPVFATLSMTRQAALLSMAYNLGLSGILGFQRMWNAIERGHFREAADEALDSKWATQVGDRAKKLSHIIEHDSLP